jgi:hypothetical protein
MLEQLQQVDTSVIQELVELKRERQTLGERLAKMEEDRGKVNEVVYRRVKRDYESRAAALERQAAPLKDRARREYAKLKALLEQVQGTLDASRLDKEELEFRHRLGEYPDDGFEKRLSEIEKALDDHEADLSEANEVKGQFLGAFDSEQDLAVVEPPKAEPPKVEPPKPEPAAPAPPPPPIAPVAAAGGATAVDPAMLARPAASGPQSASTAPYATAAPPPPPTPVEPEGTVILPPEAPAPPPAPESVAGKTVVLTRGKLVAIDTDLGAPEFALEPLSFIGRTPENQIRLNKPVVSRRHAQVTLSEGGYVLRDLNSENGTYVNGERIQERLLAHGDRVQIGTVRFVFQVS